MKIGHNYFFEKRKVISRANTAVSQLFMINYAVLQILCQLNFDHVQFKIYVSSPRKNILDFSHQIISHKL